MIFNGLNFFGAEEAKPEGIAALGFDGQAFIIQLATFLLVLFVLKKLVFKKVVDLLEKRRKTIEEGVKLSEEIKQEREKLEQQVAEAHKQARVDAEKLIADTQNQASVILKDAEDSAKTKVDRMLADAKKKIDEETEKARRSLERETVELVIKATETVAKAKVDAKKDAELISNAIRGRS